MNLTARKSQLLNSIFYLVILLTSLSIYKMDSLYFEPRVIISNFTIIVISLLFMTIGDNYNYSLNKIFMLFTFFFLGIAPAVQYQKGIVFWTNTNLTSNDYFLLNVIIIVILLLYQGMYFWFGKIKQKKLIGIMDKWSQELYISDYKMLAISMASFLLLLYLYHFNIQALLFRSAGEQIRIHNQALTLIFSNTIRPMPAVCLLFFKKSKSKNKWIESALIIILLISNFPTALPRFYVAAIYIPFLIIYIKMLRKSYLLLNKALIVGLLFIFPILDEVRRINKFSDLKLQLNFDMFSIGHFDSYQMFMHAVVNNVITHGRQLLSAILFFVPRSLWPGKSIGSGAYIAEKYKFIFANISMNYFGEGYINFGYIGIFIFTIFIAYFNARYDKRYWSNKNKRKNSVLGGFYILLLGLEFFFLRGDMLSGLSFIVGLFISCLGVGMMGTQSKRERKKDGQWLWDYILRISGK